MEEQVLLEVGDVVPLKWNGVEYGGFENEEGLRMDAC